MPLNIVFLRPQNWSRLKPYCYSTITAVKVINAMFMLFLDSAERGAIAEIVSRLVVARNEGPLSAPPISAPSGMG